MSGRMAAARFLTGALAILLWSCGGSGAVTLPINERAALTGSLPWNPLQWNVITSCIDKQQATMSTLYGNDVAVRYARNNSQQEYPAGSVISLVMWTEVEDPHWFGAKMPGQVKSVEFVSVSAGPDNQTANSYEDYEGSPLRKIASPVGPSPATRAAYLLSRRASVMP
jgi:hypothetical protein